MDLKLKRVQRFFPSFPENKKVLENIYEFIHFLDNVHYSEKLLSWAMFLDCIDEAFEIYEDLKRIDDIFQILEVLYEYFRNDPDINFKLALQLTRNGKYSESFLYSRKAFLAYKNDPRVRSLYSSICNKLVSRWHFPMLNDRIRNMAYKRAISNAISRGIDSVIDIGAGTGLLSIYSKQAGCKDVYACEQNDFMAEVARTIVELNKCAVCVIPRSSLDLTIPGIVPKRFSLAITETFDCGLLGEGSLTSLKHALKHLVLNSEGNLAKNSSSKLSRIIPSHAEVYIAAAHSSYVAKQTKCVNCEYLNGKALILDTAEPYMSENFRYMSGSFQLLSKWTSILNVDFNSIQDIDNIILGKKDFKIELDINAVGDLDCIILAFKLHLDDENCVSTFPEESSCWENAVYPMFSSERLQIGDKITLKICFTDGITICLKDCLFPSLSTRSVSDSCMLKCINNKNYLNYWKQAANEVWQMIYKESCNTEDPIKVLDLCPFPVAGLTILNKCKNVKLFTMEQESVSLMRFLGYDVNIVGEDDIFQVAFVWPFKKLGDATGTPCLSEWLKSDGIIYPNTMGVNIYGIESTQLVNASIVDDKNTCGLEIGQIFNKFKTYVQYEIDPEFWPHTKLTSNIAVFTAEIENKPKNQPETADFSFDNDCKYFLKTLKKLDMYQSNFTVCKTGELCGFIRTISLFHSKSNKQTLGGITSDKGSIYGENLINTNSPIFMNNDQDSPVDVSCHFLHEVVNVTEGERFSIKVAYSGSDMCLYDLEKL